MQTIQLPDSNFSMEDKHEPISMVIVFGNGFSDDTKRQAG
jgi:hypothetical protein